MKKAIIFFVVIFSFSLSASAANPKMSADTTATIIVHIGFGSGMGQGNRSAQETPIQAYIQTVGNDGFIVLYITRNIGMIDISITNNTTADIIQGEIDGYIGFYTIPINAVQGLYSIVFTLSNGMVYYGDFSLYY